MHENDQSEGSDINAVFSRVRIPLSDGVRLSGNLWLPAGEGQWPTIFTYTPYQKDATAGTYLDRSTRHFLRSGYAVLLVDLRGVGVSEGVTSGAFDLREGSDAREVIEWASVQPWSDGSIGMFGCSYECITAFAAAVKHPQALKAIVGIEGLFDGYRDGAFPGGVRNFLGQVGVWGGMMLGLQLLPPMWQDPDEEWQKIWNYRLENAEPFLVPWQEHLTRDTYWEERVLPVEEITVPSFLIGGWRDLFPNVMGRAYELIRGPKKLWLGPWLHGYPDTVSFEAVDYLPEVIRWFDRWLLGRENSIDHEPKVALFVQEEGWRLESSWPLQRVTPKRLFVIPSGLVPESVEKETSWLHYLTDPTVGLAAGLWEPLSMGIGLPLEQAEDDVLSLTFTSAPLDDDVEITGSPVAHVRLRVLEGNDALISVKLSRVDPGGRTALITSGIARASHRNGVDRPTEVVLGEEFSCDVLLNTTSYRVSQGARLRVSIACADFPRFWPLAYNSEIEIGAGGTDGSFIDLPFVTAEEPPEGLLPPPANVSADSFPLVVQQRPIWTIERDLITDTVRVTTGEESTFLTAQGNGTMTLSHVATASVSRSSPLGAHVVTKTEIHLKTSLGQEIAIQASANIGQSGAVLHGHIALDGCEMFDRSWRV